MTVYVVFYIHSDYPKNSEILGVFDNKEKAVSELLERANYRDKNNILTQYMLPSNDYDSFETLRNKVSEEMELLDTDIYRITEMKVE